MIHFSRTHEEYKYRKWVRVYCEYLYYMFKIFKKHTPTYTIEFKDFCRFIYLNSSGYISPYIEG